LVSDKKYRGRRIKGVKRTYSLDCRWAIVCNRNSNSSAISAVHPSGIFLQENTIINQVSIGRVTVKSTTQRTNVSTPIIVAIYLERSRGEEKEQADNRQLQQQQQPLVLVE
jgi:hypothetical protein